MFDLSYFFSLEIGGSISPHWFCFLSTFFLSSSSSFVFLSTPITFYYTSWSCHLSGRFWCLKMMIIIWNWFCILIELGLESTFLQTFTYLLLFFLDYFFQFIFLPDIVSFQKIGSSADGIPAILANHGLECTLCVDLELFFFMDSFDFFLRTHSLLIKMFPNQFMRLPHFGTNMLRLKLSSPSTSLLLRSIVSEIIRRSWWWLLHTWTIEVQLWSCVFQLIISVWIVLNLLKWIMMLVHIG